LFIFDFNIHLPCNKNSDINFKTLDENNMFLDDFEVCYKNYFDSFKFSIQAGNFMLFNQNLFFEDNMGTFIKKVKNDFKGSLFTALIDFRKQNVLSYLDKAISDGIDCIKFHSYNQKITEADFIEIVKICKYAEDRNIVICIDTSYGTSKMYDYDNMKLACFISDFILKTPIVLLHTGGARVIEAMLLADEKKNIFLDTSFSIVYYLDSSLEKDFAYTYKKIGSSRVLYGSDTPYINLNESIEQTIEFLEKYKFSSNDIENILYNTGKNLKSHL